MRRKLACVVLATLFCFSMWKTTPTPPPCVFPSLALRTTSTYARPAFPLPRPAWLEDVSKHTPNLASTNIWRVGESLRAPRPRREWHDVCETARGNSGAWPFFCGAGRPFLDDETRGRVWQDIARVVGDNAVTLHGILDGAAKTTVGMGSHPLVLYSPMGDSGAKLVIEEHVNGDSYNLNKITFDAHECLLDVGSNLGVVIIRALLGKRPPGCVVSVEAAPVTFLYQLLNLWTNVADSMRSGRVKAVHRAVGGRDGGMLRLVFNPKATTASAPWRRKFEKLENTVTVQVPFISINTIINDYMAGYNLKVLKIDCEGCEYDVIPALDDDVWNSLTVVLGEVHAQWMGEMRPSKEVEELCLRRLCADRDGDSLWHLGIAGAPWCSPYRSLP